MIRSDVSADVKSSRLTPSAQAGTRGGRRRLQTVERCGRPSCSNRVNLRGETQMKGPSGVEGGGSDFLYPSYPKVFTADG